MFFVVARSRNITTGFWKERSPFYSSWIASKLSTFLTENLIRRSQNAILNLEYITVNNARKYGTPLSVRDRIMDHRFPEGINFHADYEYFNLKDR